MSVQVYIPTPFRRATNDRDRVSLDAPDVKALLDELEERYGGLKGLIRDEQGAVHRHVNVYVNNEAIDALEGLRTPLRDGDEVSIIPALAGGAGAGDASSRDSRAPIGSGAGRMRLPLAR